MIKINNNLTSGPVFKTISLFALPLLLGNILQQFYNVVDTIIVGRFLEAGALAAVGIWWSIPIGWALADLVDALTWLFCKGKLESKG